MICKPEEAKNYQCCAMPKACEGDKCMAWRGWYQAEGGSVKAPSQFSAAPDKGCCGLAYKG
ncbi:MAG: hypothetical protein ACXWT0_00335 [Methylobacter sp.]